MITRLLIAANVAAFLWQIATGGPGMLSGNIDGDLLYRQGALAPVLVTHYHQYWRLLSAAFLHANLIHIGVNMLSLWILGNFIEPIVGSPRMLLIYFASLLVSSVGVVYFSAPDVPTLGASGAIYGLFGAIFALGFKFGKRGMELIRANIPILVINLIVTFTIPEISKAAHVAGLLAGFALTFVIYFPPRAVVPTVVDAQTGAELPSQFEDSRDDGTPYR